MINTDNLSGKAVITSEKAYTYKELLQKINSYASYYKDKSYKVVAILGENSIDWISAFYSGFVNNCIVVPLENTAQASEMAHIFNDCHPDLLFVSPKSADKVQSLLEEIDYKPEIFYLGAIEKEVEEYSWNSPSDHEKTAIIMYTSGTTATPKGVMLSFKNLIAGIEGASCKENKVYTYDREVLMLLPLHHIYPLKATLMSPLSVGATIVICPSMSSNDFFNTLKNNKIAILIAVPRFYELLYIGIKEKVDESFRLRFFYKLAKIIKSHSFSKRVFRNIHLRFGEALEFMICGGAPFPLHVGEFFNTLGFEVLEGYGMTEASPLIAMNRPGRGRLGTAGEAFPSLTIEIRDGEIVAKGNNIMKGYYNRPDETNEVLKDGWLYTGDLGYLDKDNFLHITGRKKEVLVLPSGKNINPIELEKGLEQSFDIIKEVGVCLLNNRDLHAIIYPNEDKLKSLSIEEKEKVFKEEVLPLFNEKLSTYKQIYQFSFTDKELPRTRLGKLQRFKLPELIDERWEKNKK
ncbi:AMP-binding protein [Bacteroidales bacterium OttesenSCG-928-I14]|nr:AMP-binding protein [Bacteroidales bacterium OttesenSCG-928-I14]